MISACFNIFMDRIESVNGAKTVEKCYNVNMNGSQNFSSFLKKLLERDEANKVRFRLYNLDLTGEEPGYTQIQTRYFAK